MCDKHVWYSDVAAPPRNQTYDWCVICGEPRPTLDLESWKEDEGESEAST